MNGSDTITDETIEKKIDTKLILSIIAAGIMSFSGVVVETAMNVTFPTLMEEFGIGTSTVQWITTGYLLMLACIIPASSYLKKCFTTKTLFVTAICLFIIGTVMAAVTPVFSLLLAGRLIQGVGTGIALPLMFNIVLEQVPEERLGLMMGIASLITAMAPAVGPSIGGLIVSNFGWRMIFVALLPLLVLAFLFGIFSIRQVTDTKKISFQFADYLFLAAGFACFIFATSTASESGWTSVPVIVLFLASIISLVIFYRRSIRSKNPLIDLHVFRTLPFTLSVFVILLIQFICLGLGFLIPNYAQIVSGQDAFLAGCLLLPGCLLGAVLSPVSGRILDRFGAERPILAGLFSGKQYDKRSEPSRAGQKSGRECGDQYTSAACRSSRDLRCIDHCRVCTGGIDGYGGNHQRGKQLCILSSGCLICGHDPLLSGSVCLGQTEAQTDFRMCGDTLRNAPESLKIKKWKYPGVGMRRRDISIKKRR